VCLQRDKQDIRRLYVCAGGVGCRLLAEKSTSGIFYAFPIRHMYACVSVCILVFLFIYCASLSPSPPSFCRYE